MNRIFTVTNQKGGVGKTTTAHILACYLAHKGHRTLVVDADPQSNITLCSDIKKTPKTNLYDLVTTSRPPFNAVYETEQGYSIIVGSDKMAGHSLDGDPFKFKGILAPLFDRFDYCVIDTPPTLSMTTINALSCSTGVIVPLLPDILSLQGLSQLKGVIDTVKEKTNPYLNLEGLLVTKYSSRSVINRTIFQEIQKRAGLLDTKVFNATIREAVAIKECQLLKKNLFADYPKAKVTEDYTNFIEELLKGAMNG